MSSPTSTALNNNNLEDSVVADSSKEPRHHIWGSARMSYVVCAFLAMVLHICMRSTLSFVILCMVRQEDDAHKLNNTLGHNLTNTLEMSEGLPWTRSQQFTLLGSFYYGYLITLPIGGRLADKFGGKLLFIYSIVAQAVVFFLTPLLTTINYTIVILARILQGLIAGCGNPALYQLFTKWAHPNERTAFLSFAYSGYSVSTLIVFPLSSLFCRFGWETAFYTIGGISFVIGISFHRFVYSCVEEHPRISRAEYEYLKESSTEKSKRKIPWLSVLKSMPVYAFTITHICHTYGIIVFTLMTPIFLKEAMNFPLPMVGLASAVPFLGSTISNIITMTIFSWIEKRPGLNLTKFRRIFYAACNAVTILAIAGIILCDSTHHVLVVILMFCIGISTDFAFSGAYWPSLLYVAPSYAGLLSGIANCLATITGFIAPLVTSSIVKEGTKSEWDYVMLTLVTSYAFAAAVYGLFGSSKLQHWDNNEHKSSSRIKTDNSNVKKV